jgi:hypothetical protein
MITNALLKNLFPTPSLKKNQGAEISLRVRNQLIKIDNGVLFKNENSYRIQLTKGKNLIFVC